MITRASIGVLLAGLGLGLAACEQKNDPSVPRDSTTPRASDVPNSPNPPAADNTAVNRPSTESGEKTPLDQSQSAADVKITADIRRAIMDDKAMSFNAQNCKIITDRGVVTLRGVVNSADERQSIEAKAKAAAGVLRVDNQLDTKTN